jgi:hypothetical protein
MAGSLFEMPVQLQTALAFPEPLTEKRMAIHRAKWNGKNHDGLSLGGSDTGRATSHSQSGMQPGEHRTCTAHMPVRSDGRQADAPDRCRTKLIG